MIDHMLGRPSVKSRRLQVLAVLTVWTAVLARGPKHGLPGLQCLSRFLSKRLTAWQTFLITMLYLYAARNFSTLVGLACPDPLTNMYDPAYFRATWVLTALDAGFWTAMTIRNRVVREAASIVFSLFYLFAADKADEKVRKVRGNITVEHMRVSWNKGSDSYVLSTLQGLMRPRDMKWPPRQVRIPRPATSDYKKPIDAWLYYNGPLSELRHHTEIILDIPGGGFVAMNPRCNDDKLFSWAAKTGKPILSLDYKKAPEYPYPYALNECYDAYKTIIQTRGRCINLSGHVVPKIIITGDSAGGNLATATTLMIIESGSSPVRRFEGDRPLPVPDGLVLFYPALDMNIGSWMSDEQMTLIKDRRMRGTNQRVMQRKESQYLNLVGHEEPKGDGDYDSSASKTATLVDSSESAAGSPTKSHDAEPAPEYATSGSTTFSHVRQAPPAPASPTITKSSLATSSTSAAQPGASHHPQPMRTRLAMSSMISYFNDRVLTPEMMRGMVILYIGSNNRPDFSRDYLLSPILAPAVLLAKFPKTYFLTGERDPLVDDTIIFAGRLRRVKAAAMASGGERLEYRDEDALTPGFDQKAVAEVTLVPGISHGFLQFPTLYPPARLHINKAADWFEKLFKEAWERDRKQRGEVEDEEEEGLMMGRRKTRRARGAGSGSSGDKMDEELRKAAAEVAAEQEYEAKSSSSAGGASGKRRYHLRCESSGSEDQPLEMMRMTKLKGKKLSNGDSGMMSPATTPEVQVNGKSTSRTVGQANKTTDSTNASASAVSGKPATPPGSEPAATITTNGRASPSSALYPSSAAAKRGAKSSKKSRKEEDDTGLVKLASTEDLLKRRMHGLASTLTGLRGDPE